MKDFLYKGIIGIIFICLITPVAFGNKDNSGSKQNKELCEKMLRLGQESYWRGRYLDAKQYFKKAIKADPSNEKAWRFYDLASIFALAEKVEKNQGLIAPDVSVRKEIPPSGTQVSTPEVEKPKQQIQPKQEEEFVIEEDEGC